MDMIIGSTVGLIVIVGLALAAFIVRATSRADWDRAEATADRNAFQTCMDEFPREMQLLAEHQPHV